MGRAFAFDDLYRLRTPGDPQLSPDGTQVAFVLTTADRERDEMCTAVWVVPVDASEPPRPLTAGRHDGSPRWSPDGKLLAYVAAGADGGKAQVWLVDGRGGAPRQLTSLPGGAGGPVWSPDGGSLAVSTTIDLDEGAPDHAPVVVERLGYKADGAGLLKNKRQHLVVVPVDGGETRQLTFGDWSIGSPTWTPDGTALVVGGSRGDDRDVTGVNDLYRVPVHGNARPQRLTPANGSAGMAVFSSDGSSLIYAGDTSVAVGHTRLLAIPADLSEPVEPRQLPAGLDRNVMVGGPGYPGARPQLAGDRLVFCARDGGVTRAYVIDQRGGEATPILGGGDESVGGLSVLPDGSLLAAVVGTPTSSGEIVITGPEGAAPRVITSFAADDLDGIDLVTPEVRRFTAPDGTSIEGWLLRDPSTTGPAPTLVDIHGGPHNAWNAVLSWSTPLRLPLVADGWNVLFINPRGSDGYGEDFFTGVVGGWGVNDAQDFLCAIDALIEEGIADPDRLAVTGYSYGGFMTNWLTARTDRFKAGVTGGCVTSMTSIYGTSDLGRLLGVLEAGSAPHDDPELLARQSPLTYVGQVTAPTLVLHGERDDRCPISEAEQWFTALRDRGVPTEMVRYPGGSHLFLLMGRPTHRIDYCRRVSDWVKRYTVESDTPRRRPLARRLAGIDGWLAETARRHHLPGVSVAVMQGDETVEAAAGVLNIDTQQPATTSSLFQIGSITKVFTTSLLMQLHDEGRFDLDDPVAKLLPGFAVGDPEASATITVRHLLTHTSGLHGDVITDKYGRGDDAIERYVVGLREVGQVHPVGLLWSYCNSGFVVAGRIAEVLTGLPYYRALQERLLVPAGITTMLVRPEDILRHPAAMGHVPNPDDPAGWPLLCGDYGIQYSCAPAGSVPAARAVDLLNFARLHLAEGRAPDGTEVLSAAAVKLMQERQVKTPNGEGWWGLGWSLPEIDGHRFIAHGGGTKGQASMLQVLPDDGIGVAVLTNGPGGMGVIQAVTTEILGELVGLTVPSPAKPPATPVELDVSRYEGEFENWASTFTVMAGDAPGSLTIAMTMSDRLDDPPQPSTTFPVSAVSEDRFAMPGMEVRFLEPQADGRYEYLHLGRAARRVR